MPMSNAERVNKRRQQLRSQGLRPLQLWVPDTRQPGFQEECRRQALITAQADQQDRDLLEQLDEMADDLLEDAE